MTAPTCGLWLHHGIPVVVHQALDDTSLTHAARLLMWHLGKRLDVVAFVEVKVDSVTHQTRMAKMTVVDALRVLVERGYLDARQGRGRLREYRLPNARLQNRSLKAA
jgi:hypothetical protein